MRTRPEEWIDERGQQLQRALSKIRGLKLAGPNSGGLQWGRMKALVTMDPGDWIRVTLPLESAPPTSALEINHQLASNVRFASAGRHAYLAADTLVDGEVHLTRSFQEIRTSFSLAVNGHRGRKLRCGDDEAIRAEATQAAMLDLNWEKEAVVQRDDGWELRPRIDGEVVPLQATIEQRRLHLCRTVLDALPAGVTRSVLDDQSMRFNRRLRLARLAIADNCLVAESCLHAQLITPHWISLAARAVATASRHTQPTLQALTQNHVAELYATLMFP